MNLLNLTVIAAAVMAFAACSSTPAPRASQGGAAGTASEGTSMGLPLSGPVEVPESANWNNPGVSKEQNRADLESCYGYSYGQVQHDMQIEDDRATLRDDDLGIGFVELNRSMNAFDFRNRRESLFEDCMESKGYALN